MMDAGRALCLAASALVQLSRRKECISGDVLMGDQG